MLWNDLSVGLAYFFANMKISSTIVVDMLLTCSHNSNYSELPASEKNLTQAWTWPGNWQYPGSWGENTCTSDPAIQPPPGYCCFCYSRALRYLTSRLLCYSPVTLSVIIHNTNDSVMPPVIVILAGPGVGEGAEESLGREAAGGDGSYGAS